MSKKIHTDDDIAKLRTILSPRLRAARKQLGLTQEQTAEFIGISSEFYARMERGHALPSVATLRQMARTLGVTVDHLLGANDKSAERPGPPSYPKLPRQVRAIVDKARSDRELARVIVHVLKLCQEKSG